MLSVQPRIVGAVPRAAITSATEQVSVLSLPAGHFSASAVAKISLNAPTVCAVFSCHTKSRTTTRTSTKGTETDRQTDRDDATTQLTTKEERANTDRRKTYHHRARTNHDGRRKRDDSTTTPKTEDGQTDSTDKQTARTAEQNPELRTENPEPSTYRWSRQATDVQIGGQTHSRPRTSGCLYDTPKEKVDTALHCH